MADGRLGGERFIHANSPGTSEFLRVLRSRKFLAVGGRQNFDFDTCADPPMSKAPSLSCGQLVKVHSYRSVQATLDDEGKLDGLPFMPEMIKMCGQIFRVVRRVERTCVVGVGMRQMRNTVFLEDARCDGTSHDGCQRACLLFWKEAWLSAVDQSVAADTPAPGPGLFPELPLPTRRGDRYVCQSTELASATLPSGRWNLMPFLREIGNGELSIRAFFGIVLRVVRGRLFRSEQNPPLSGSGGGKSTGSLGLTSGEWVNIKSKEAICSTLNDKGANRGLVFKPTMTPAIGQRHRVLFRVHKIILEQEGTMATLNNTVALDGVVCAGECVHHCPRAEFLYWRESWLERADTAVVNELT